MLNRSKLLISCLMLACFGLCIAIAFYTLFSNFRAYDDEGILLAANQLFLAGKSFYTDIPWIYGPGYLATVSLLNDWLAVPLTHSAVRFTTLCYWMFLCTVSGLLMYKLSRSPLWSIATFSLVFIFTKSIVNEPGHPQALVAIGSILVPLAACYARPGSQRFLWFSIGLITACIFHMKINAGVFSFAAAATVLVVSFRAGEWRSLLSAAIIIGSVLFPFVLMFPLLAQPNALPFAIICAAGLGSAAITVRCEKNSGLDIKVTGSAFITGFLLVTILALMFAGAHGATPFDIISSLLSYSRSQVEFYHFFREYSGFQLISAGASLVMAFCCGFANKNTHRGWMITAGKIYFVSVALYSMVVNDPAHAHAMLGYAGPWCWVLATRVEGREFPVARLLLVTTAVWSPLLAYPVPGSQIYFGSLTILLAALVCATDMLTGVVCRWPRLATSCSGGFHKGVSLLVVMVVLVVLVLELKRVREVYSQFKPLDLPGTQLMRIEPRRGQVYRELVRELNDADVALTTFRFNSIYFWSSAAMAGSIYHAHSLAYSLPSEQGPIKEDLLRAAHPVVIKRDVPSWAVEPQADILEWIEDNFEPYRKIGQYTLMKPREDSPADAEI